MGPVLNPLTSAKGLDRARLVLDNLGACLGQAKHIYDKYHGGWSIRKCWVTPGKILEKTLRTKSQISEAYQELTVALGIDNYFKREETPPTIPFEESQKTWEIPFKDLEFSLNRHGIPKKVLGQGAFGIVGLATWKGEQVRFWRSSRCNSIFLVCMCLCVNFGTCKCARTNMLGRVFERL